MDFGERELGPVVPIASHSDTPCVGNPMDWDRAGGWFTCAAEGRYALVAAVPEGSIFEPGKNHDGEPVLVIITACKEHLRSVRSWLRSNNPYFDDPLVMSTTTLQANYADIVSGIDLPVFAPVSKAV